MADFADFAIASTTCCGSLGSGEQVRDGGVERLTDRGRVGDVQVGLYEGDLPRAVATPRRIGSEMPTSAPLAVGRPMPSLAQPVWTGLLTRNWRNCAQAGSGAFHEQE